MIYLVIAFGLFLLWSWSRSEIIRRGGWRVFAGIAALALVVVGVSLSIRGDWFIGLPMVLLALGSALSGRYKRGARRPASSMPPQRSSDGMSAADARSILGVGSEASKADIRAAYTRLMQRAHPDKGGSAGLAAQLNAARDRLLKA
jgi:DnaJ-domain-containing protein 1